MKNSFNKWKIRISADLKSRESRLVEAFCKNNFWPLTILTKNLHHIYLTGF